MATIALSFGLGLPMSTIRTIEGSVIKPHGAWVRVGDETRTARVEVSTGAHEPVAVARSLGEDQHTVCVCRVPLGVNVSSTVLRETWAVAQLRDEVDFSQVAAVVGRYVAVWALEASTSYRGTCDLALRYDVSTVERAALRPRLRLVVGGKS